MTVRSDQNLDARDLFVTPTQFARRYAVLTSIRRVIPTQMIRSPRDAYSRPNMLLIVRMLCRSNLLLPGKATDEMRLGLRIIIIWCLMLDVARTS